MISENNDILSAFARSIRSLAIDAIEAANSGHPGLPLGCADIVGYLYAEELRYSPQDPKWANRDRFVLSAGHGSMVLYPALHLAGYDLSLDDIKAFRQWGSKTPGHPEFGITDGVETTTGPLGQGLATAVGMALAVKMQRARLSDSTILNPNIFVLCGDGDLMEGVSAEASSFAGHLALDNLIVFYDSNDICLDGPIDECFTENVQARYEAYGWDVFAINGHDFEEIAQATASAKKSKKPVLIIAKTTIGLGSPNRAGTSESHGKPLGKEEAVLTKKALDIPTDKPFWIDSSLKAFFDAKAIEANKMAEKWKKKLSNEDLKVLNPSPLPADLMTILSNVVHKENGASREASNAIIQTLKSTLDHFIVGSADLSCSDNTVIKNDSVVQKNTFIGRNIKFGVREFAMAAIANGLSLDGYFIPVIGTFMTFSDYMKNGIRLAALMKLKVIYHFTHDSIFLGEDGPTHQPIEHLAALRAMPGLTVIRPADAAEAKGAWSMALQAQGPVALVMSRQGLPDLTGSRVSEVEKGAYVVKPESSTTHIDYCLIATGAEVSLALDVANSLEADGLSVRVVSMPSFELFNAQPTVYKRDILPTAVQRVSIEAQSRFGWGQYIGINGLAISIDHFGESAPASVLKEKFGFNVNSIKSKIKAHSFD